MKKFMAAIISGLLIVSMTSAAFADTTTTTTSKECNFENIMEKKQEALDQAVKNGKITQEQADQIMEKLENKDFTKLRNNAQRLLKKSKGFQFDKKSREEMNAIHIEILADLTGKSVDEINKLVNEDNQRFYEIAKEADVAKEYRTAVKEKMSAMRAEQLDNLLKEGKITEEKYNSIKEKAEDMKVLHEILIDIDIHEKVLDTISEITGKSVDEIKDLRQNPQEFKQYIQDNDLQGKIHEAVRTTITEAKENALKEKLDNGDITQEQYDKYVKIINQKPARNGKKGIKRSNMKMTKINRGNKVTE